MDLFEESLERIKEWFVPIVYMLDINMDWPVILAFARIKNFLYFNNLITMCEISVVMPVYNAEMHIKDAIESVLEQSFVDFEFILIDDGSTDRTSSIIQSYNDKRVRLIQNSHNFIESLNLGIENSLGKYMARMDGDDIMHIDRLKIQYAIMQEYPDVTVCGTWMNSIGTYSQTNGLLSTLSGWVGQPLLKFTKGNFLFHPTTMIRMDF